MRLHVCWTTVLSAHPSRRRHWFTTPSSVEIGCAIASHDVAALASKVLSSRTHGNDGQSSLEDPTCGERLNLNCALRRDWSNAEHH